MSIFVFGKTDTNVERWSSSWGRGAPVLAHHLERFSKRSCKRIYTSMVPLVFTRTGGCFSYNTAGPSTESVGIKVSSVKTELEHLSFAVVGKQLEDDMAISIYLSLFKGKVYLETPFGSQRFGTWRHCQCWHKSCGDLTWSMVQPHVRFCLSLLICSQCLIDWGRWLKPFSRLTSLSS